MRAVLLALSSLALIALLGVTLSQLLTPTSAETSSAQMRLKVTSGGVCVGQKCTVPPGDAFTLVIEATTVNADGSFAFQTQVNYNALVQAGGSYKPVVSAVAEVTAPTACGYPGIAVRQNNPATNIVGHGGTAGFPGSFNTCTLPGDYITLAMNCSPIPSSSEILLVPCSENNTLGTGFWSVPSGNPNVVAKTNGVTITCGYVPNPADADIDGCTVVQENSQNEELGGDRSDANFWDFFDTPDTAGMRNKSIDLFGDIFGVANRFGANDANGSASPNRNSNPFSLPPTPPGYHPAFDRSPPPVGGDPWDLGPADGVIDLFADIFAAATQFGHDCN